MFKRVLVANRGEIAVRIIRALHELNIEAVAIYSEGDENSLHTQIADYAIRIGPAFSKDSYLNIKSIISAAEVSGADAIHPGYGFLAENEEFAKIVEECGFKFIGPSPESIKLMGDKIEAKRVMKEAGVPVIPGTEEAISNIKEGLKFAKEVGFPVIIKAAAGGGGKGMRIVRNEEDFEKQFKIAQIEAEKAFGDNRVYIEKFLEKPRHIEVQVLGDSYGNVIHLFERESSIQRRHQKLIEEAPSPALDEETRKKLTEAAVKGAKAIKYQNAGTMEFLYSDGKFYFMEMNTRIQVEHPVTEEITHIDIVKQQILIAAGEKLNIKQKEINKIGHAIEIRINAEDPEKNFRPSPGKIEVLHLPGGPGIRIDTHIYQGYVIPPYYDSLIAKMIAWGRTREEAIKRLNRAINETLIKPIKTTLSLHKKIINNRRFIEGELHTKFLEEMGIGD